MDENETRPPAKSPTRKRLVGANRWSTPILVIIACVILFFTLDARFSLTGRPTMDMLLILALANFVLYVWIRVGSGLSTGTQFRTVGIGIALQALVMSTVQMEGIYGNGRPVFAWRWSPLPADAFRESTNPGNGPAAIRLPQQAAWSQFRGNNRNGISPFHMANWKEHSPRLLWKKPVGSGWSSFAVAGDYCFTMEQRGDEECVVCYALSSGEQMWVHAEPERFSEISGGEGPRTTPAYDNGFLYTLGATGILNCLDARNGEKIWSVDILKRHDAQNAWYGVCGSPLVVGDRVIVCPGGKNASMVACDKRNGNLIWAAGSAESSYSSPQPMKLCDVEQVLNFNSDGLTAHELESGRQLWHVPWISNEAERNNVCQPIQTGPDRVFLSSGYGRGAALLKISRDGENFQAETVWSNRNLKSKFASAVYDGRHIYGLDEGILVCLDAETGQRLWKNGRYYHGQIVLSGEFLVVQAENGYIAQVHADSKRFVEAGRVDALDRRTWTHPVVTAGFLLTRNDRQIACYRVTPAPSP